MINSASERLISRILAIGAGFTTILVISGSVTEPVNAPKLFSLSIVACAALFVIIFSKVRSQLNVYKLELCVIFLFVLFSLNSIVWSKSPFSQSFYGVYGRNNGFLTYLLLAVILISALTLKSPVSFKFIMTGLLWAGYTNIVYCLWVIAFGDFIGWSNPYGNILGTLGNPNFIGAFLGIFLGSYVAFAVSRSSSRLYRYASIVVLPVTAFEITKSHAIQGRVVGVVSVGIVIFYLLRAKFSNLVVAIYVALAASLGSISLLGALQIGPMTDIIYKTSVSLRGQYWLSGWNTGLSHPFTGVGMDSFGDWYRRARDAHALVLPGTNTVVDASHNVFIDMFAFGGFPLLLSYAILVGLVLVAIARLTQRKKSYDPVFVALVTAWSGYQLQAIISINQIGLAIWGWLLSGALLAYEKSSRANPEESSVAIKLPGKKTGNSQNTHLTMVATFGFIIGIILGIPPLTADASWRAAQIERSLTKTEASMARSYFNPPNTNKFGNNVQTLESSQLFELSHKYALDAVRWNPESYELWRMLYSLKNTTPAEKELALENMKRLDPLNPDVTSIQ